MASVLHDIIVGVRQDLAERQSRRSLADLEAALPGTRPALDARAALAAVPAMAVIAEVKRASPSKGALSAIVDPAGLAGSYADGGAAAISVLTEQRRFNGSVHDLADVRARVDIPVLRKDFMLTHYQLTEARVFGADLVLLIVAALDQPTLVTLHQHAESLGMTVLVEVHDEDETRRAVDCGASVIGVNARNLKTLDVDPATFGRLRPLVPDGILTIAESGIRTRADVERFAAEGAHGVLVGEALVTGSDPASAVADFASVPRQAAVSV